LAGQDGGRPRLPKAKRGDDSAATHTAMRRDFVIRFPDAECPVSKTDQRDDLIFASDGNPLLSF